MIGWLSSGTSGSRPEVGAAAAVVAQAGSTRRIHLAVLLAGALVLAACGGDNGELSVTAPDTRFDVEPGDVFSVVLESNPTTGYAWSLAEPLPAAVLRLVEDSYLEPDTDLVGAGGQQELTFEAMGDGSTYIQLWYVRSFDDPPEPAERAQFEVIVGSGVPADADVSDDGDRPQPEIPDDEAALTVAELLAAEPGGEVVVRGALFDDGSGLVLCGALAESFPPQCPGESVPVANPEAIDVELASAGAARWSDQPFTLLGVLADDGFKVVASRPG